MASLIYQELSKTELNELVSAALQTRLLSAHLLKGGLFNTTYMVETEKYGRSVLRIGPVNRHLLMPFEHHLMAAEEYVYTLCAQQNIPVSDVLKVDLSKTIIDRDFMFVRYIPSRPMSEENLTPQERAGIFYDVGAAAAKMHSITAPRFGRVLDVKNGKGFQRWSEALLYELTMWEEVGIPASIFTSEEHKQIRTLYRKAAPYLDEITSPRLVHTDLWPGNILIDDSGDIPRFAAIIDADRAIFGDPAFEFSSIQWTYGEESFWKGYGSPLPGEPADLIRRCVYTHFNRLMNAYAYLIEYNQPESAQWEAADARTQIAKLEKLL